MKTPSSGIEELERENSEGQGKFFVFEWKPEQGLEFIRGQREKWVDVDVSHVTEQLISVETTFLFVFGAFFFIVLGSPRPPNASNALPQIPLYLSGHCNCKQRSNFQRSCHQNLLSLSS